jgi:hypothetical protein
LSVMRVTRANRRNELQEVVDEPNETLENEYKSWLDLNQPEARASLARHIAALANHGGGRIIFGINDQMKYAGPCPNANSLLDHDAVASVVKRYLEPPLQCDVFIVESATGNEHPVIVVPPHGAAPICAKADGPYVNGKNTGIAKGAYYIRKPGPESAQIENAREWSSLIRRCVMHERTAILAAIDASLRGLPSAVSRSADDELREWHEAAYAMFLRKIEKFTGPPELAKCNVQFSYIIEREDGQRFDPNELTPILLRINSEVRDLVQTGWSMFHIFTKPGIAPAFTTDPAIERGEQDFLECSLLADTSAYGADTWRAGTDGKATLIREYWEDNDNSALRTGLNAGSWFSPNMMARSIGEFVRHARGIAERFKTPSTVAFRCQWRGLEGRRVYDPGVLWRSGTVAPTNDRVVRASFPVAALSSDWQRIVAELGAPVARLFGIGDVFTPEWIAGQASSWRPYK